MEYVKETAVNMHKYDMKDLVRAHYIQMLEFDPKVCIT